MKMPAALSTFLTSWKREYAEFGKAVALALTEAVTKYIPTVHVVGDVGEAAAMDIENLPFETPLFVLVINETAGESFMHISTMGAGESFSLEAAANAFNGSNGITLTTGPASKITLGTDVQTTDDVLHIVALGI